MPADPWLEIETNTEVGSLKFNSIEEMDSWLETERQAWTWLRGLGTQPGQELGQHIRNRLGNLSNSLNNHRAQIEQEDSRQRVKNEWQQQFPAQRQFPLSGSARALFIFDIRDKISPDVAASALGAFFSSPALGNYDQFYGASLMASFDGKWSSETSSATKSALTELETEFRSRISDVQALAKKQSDALKRQRKYNRDLKKRLLSEAERDADALISEKTKEFDQAVQEFKETEQAYKEFMKLKAPVEYWSKKAGNHETKALGYRTKLMWFAGVASVATIAGLLGLAAYAINITTETLPGAVYFILATVGVVGTTIVFWIARILTRLYLSEHHLAIDADERSVMAETYLALIAEGAADTEERQLVLSALFRPTADGIVKDDAAPDITPAGLMSRFVAR